MTDRIARWRNEHAQFARLLDLLERQLQVFLEGRRPDYRLMLDIMYYLTHYADEIHHPREELAFAKAAWRDPEIVATVESLTAEHDALRQTGDALVAHLEAILNEAVLPRTEVVSSGHYYIRCLREHMRREEDIVYPVLARTLGSEAWEEVERAVAGPLYGPRVQARFGALCREIVLETRALP